MVNGVWLIIICFTYTTQPRLLCFKGKCTFGDDTVNARFLIYLFVFYFIYHDTDFRLVKCLLRINISSSTRYNRDSMQFSAHINIVTLMERRNIYLLYFLCEKYS